MATHYCIHGATNNGDGTTSAEAATPGGVGAFNDALACFSGTQAGINDGDTVIFKTHDGVSNIGFSVATGFFIVGAAAGSKRTYIMDDGSVWPGNAGTFEITITAALTVEQESRAFIYGGDYRLEFRVDSDGVLYRYQNQCYFDGLAFRQINVADPFNRLQIMPDSFGFVGRLGKLKCVLTKLSGSSAHYWGLQFDNSKATLELDEYHYEFTAKPASGEDHGIITANPSHASNIEITHLKLINPPNNIKLVDLAQTAGQPQYLHVHNMEVNDPDYLFTVHDPDVLVDIDNLVVNGVGVGQSNFLRQSMNVRTKWLSGKNYPTLNAFLPDDVTKWSIKAEFDDSVQPGETRKTSGMQNYYDQGDAQKTLTIELLIYTGFVSPQADEFFAVFTYTDTTGVVRSESTLAQGALPTSSATWDSTSYGGPSFNKHKLELTTQHQIKSGSVITAETFINADIPDAQSFNFINPQIDVS